MACASTSGSVTGAEEEEEGAAGAGAAAAAEARSASALALASSSSSTSAQDFFSGSGLAAPSAIGADREEIDRRRAELVVGSRFLGLMLILRFGRGFILCCRVSRNLA